MSYIKTQEVCEFLYNSAQNSTLEEFISKIQEKENEEIEVLPAFYDVVKEKISKEEFIENPINWLKDKPVIITEDDVDKMILIPKEMLK